MFVPTLLLVLIWTILGTTGINGQTSCQFRSTVESLPAKGSWSIFENFSTRKCLRVENFGHFPDRKLILEACSYGKTALREQKLFIEESSLGGQTLKVDPGLGSEKYCLTIKDGTLYNDECRPSSFEQNWRLKPVRGQPNQYLIMQTSSQKCLIPRGRETRSTIKLVPCNAFQTEQIWKICSANQ